MHRNKSVDVHQFAMVPKADIPRSRFKMQHTHKTTFDAGFLIPIYVDEVYPGDAFNLKMTAFARMATPIFPLMDNLHLDSFFFFVPYRLVWQNFKRFMGEEITPGASTSFVIPKMNSPVGGYAAVSLGDYMGLPTAGQVLPGNTVQHSALFMRAYGLIWNEWFRDENLQTPVTVDLGDGPDATTSRVLLRRGKRHDYFTGALPFPQKGQSVSVPLGLSATVRTNGATRLVSGAQPGVQWAESPTGNHPAANITMGAAGFNGLQSSIANAPTLGANLYPTNLYADLSTATAATINQLRQSFQIQKLLERDARGGTRYTEIIRSHFGVVSPDARLQRPEYLGGGTSSITINPIAQTSGSPGAGQYTNTPMGTLAAMGTALAGGHGFTQAFTEHGCIIGLVSVRADLTYQQGMKRMWSRDTRFDFPWPVFTHLGEQSILSKEIYCDGSTADNDVFGYQERYGELRYNPSMITGYFRSTNPTPIDAWHAAQEFSTRPLLNATFIEERPPIDRIVAVGSAAAGQQFIMDTFFNINAARPIPMYGVPGLIDHF